MFHHLRNKDLRMAVGFYYAVGILLFWFAQPAAAAPDMPRGYSDAYLASPYAALSLCINGKSLDEDYAGPHCDLCSLTAGAALLPQPDDAGRRVVFNRIFAEVQQSVSPEKLFRGSGLGARSPPSPPAA